MSSCLHFWNSRVDSVAVVCLLSASGTGNSVFEFVPLKMLHLMTQLYLPFTYFCIMKTDIWKATLNWIPRSDITFLKIVFHVWYDGEKVFHWKHLLCSGTDNEYSVCEMLKGETLVEEFDIKGLRTQFLKGNYNIIIQGFSDDSENNMVICLNFTMIVKQDVY
ncbi:lymphocyte antigen 96 isoform X3 [Corapipo altera]|uniref:lymphocyte antigen 96 isoform X3 n=1 Tax=Corapipo altera TaxID=415028 RepID=UPI000FD62EA7|nr:lymphocyte antigen 96 isoform X3 [Corapipo altera]